MLGTLHEKVERRKKPAEHMHLGMRIKVVLFQRPGDRQAGFSGELRGGARAVKKRGENGADRHQRGHCAVGNALILAVKERCKVLVGEVLRERLIPAAHLGNALLRQRAERLVRGVKLSEQIMKLAEKDFPVIHVVERRHQGKNMK